MQRSLLLLLSDLFALTSSGLPAQIIITDPVLQTEHLNM